MKKQLLLSAACLSASLLSVQAQIYFEDDFNRTTGLGSDWSVGDTARPNITGNQVTYSGNMSPEVVGVDLSSTSIGQIFKVSVEFKYSANAYTGLWFLGDTTTGNESGYALRVRHSDGNLQFLNFNGGANVDLGDFVSGSGPIGSLGADYADTYRMTLTSSSTTSTGVFTALVENVTESTVVGSSTATLADAFSGTSHAVGKSFGIYQDQAANIAFNDNFLVAIPEPGSFALIFGTFVGAIALVRRRR